MRRQNRVVFGLALVMAACGGDNAFGPDGVGNGDPSASLAGTYTLTSVDGQLPYVFFQNSAGRTEFYGGTMVMRADRSYTETLNVRAVFSDGAPSQTDNAVETGTFTVNGTQLTFAVPPIGQELGYSYNGTLNGRNFTYTYNGVVFAYTRQ